MPVARAASGDLCCCGRQNDRVKWRAIGNPSKPSPCLSRILLRPQLSQTSASPAQQWPDPFDRIHLPCKLCQYRLSDSRSPNRFQAPFGDFHPRASTSLMRATVNGTGNRLAIIDRQGNVVISAARQNFFDKNMPGNATHRCQYRLITDALRRRRSIMRARVRCDVMPMPE